MIHGVATFNKYAASLKQSGEWAKEHAGLRYLKDLTPELVQQYLVDRAAQGNVTLSQGKAACAAGS